MYEEINIEYINPFIIGASMVFGTLLHVDLQKGILKVIDNLEPSYDVIVNIEIKGHISGFVIYSIEFSMVNKIAEVLLPGMSDEQVKSEYKDIVGELVNMITGNALNVLSSNGLDISTPTVMSKDEFVKYNSVNSSVPVIKFNSPLGQMEISVALQ